MKDKKILIIAAASAVIVIALLVIFMPPGNKTDDGPEVISMRAKVEPPSPVEETQTPPLEAATGASADGTQPAAAPATAAQNAPAVVPAQAPMGTPPAHTTIPPATAPIKKAEPATAAQLQAPAEPAVKKAPAAPAVKKEEPGTEAPVKKAQAKKEEAKPAAKKAKSDNASKPFAVNVASFANLPEAQSLAGALKKAGYNSYITPFAKDDVQWQRVRVGFFTTREEAMKAGKAIQSKFRVEAPWIVKPDLTERKAH